MNIRDSQNRNVCHSAGVASGELGYLKCDKCTRAESLGSELSVEPDHRVITTSCGDVKHQSVEISAGVI